jgi:pimeloyl-ACP methyl ester carboxylesterase
MEASETAQRFAHEQWPYEPKFKRVNGWRMHYVDEGAGDPVVLLHGNPAWGFLYRKFIKPLTAAGRRVIVPDMVGFGLSEKPVREQAHTLDGHIANLTGLLRQLDVRNATIVCHDWGGPTGLGFALSNPDRVRALVIMSTWAWPLPPAEFHTRIFPWRMMHAPPSSAPIFSDATMRLQVGGCTFPSSTARRSGRKPRASMRTSCLIQDLVCSRGPGPAGSRSTKAPAAWLASNGWNAS